VSPRVSVCIPTRDRARWLGEALDSALAQTFTDLEVVVSDDASTDGSGALVGARRDPRVRLFRNPRPLGVAGNRNACLARARGSYIAWLDSDDRWLPGMLETQVGALEAHPGAALAHGAFQIIDRDGRRRPDWDGRSDPPALQTGRDAFADWITGNAVAAPTVVVRRSAQDVAGRYREDLPSSEDWEMWLRLALVGDVVYSRRPLGQYRWHADSLTRAASADGAQIRRDLRAVMGVLDTHGSAIAEPRVLRRRAASAISARAILSATDALTRGHRRRAFDLAVLAVRARPRSLSGSASWQTLLATAKGDEYLWHTASRAWLATLTSELTGTPLECRLMAMLPDPAWERELRSIAQTVAAVVPRTAAVAAVDKWDPTLLHHARRRGWHFPDRGLLPDGYPEDSESAVRHLGELRRRGASYLVLPRSSFWWLEHYPGLARHLDDQGERLWSDERCTIFRLADPEAHAA